MNIIDILVKRYDNASNYKVNIHNINNYEPIINLNKNIYLIIRDLKENEEDQSRVTIRKLYNLLSSVSLTLLPFDSKELNLYDQINDLVEQISYYPHLVKYCNEVYEVIEFINQNPQNLKRSKVLDLLNEHNSEFANCGLIAKLVKYGATPGWNEKLINELNHNFSNCDLIFSKKVFKNKVFDSLIIPSGSRNIDYKFLYTLFYSCSASIIEVVKYSIENFQTPDIVILPKGNLSKSVSRIDNKKTAQTIEEVFIDEDLKSLFDEFIKEETNQSDLQTDNNFSQFKLEVKPVLLAADKLIYLKNNMQVIEISDLIEGGVSLEEKGNKLPRVPVNNLREDDLIVLRTSGSGEYLVDLANQIMLKDGKKKLREEALSWKQVLKNVLENYGSSEIAKKLTQSGLYKSPQGYVWIWTTNDVIRPNSLELFNLLMLLLKEYGELVDGADPTLIALKKWQQMGEVLQYHMKAGRVIRTALLKKLRELISTGVQISDSYHLTLKGLDVGEMSVFRVSAIYPETVMIEYSKVGRVFKRENY